MNMLIQVNRVKQQALSKEEVFQTKILELEAEKSRRDNEMRLLHQSKHTVWFSFRMFTIEWNSPMLSKVC